MAIRSFSSFGYEGCIVTVEVDLRRGIPSVDMVGLADGAVKESRERMRSAIRNQGYEFPDERVLISLSPADVRKEGACFDLPLALAVLRAEQLHDEGKEETEDVLVMGELTLSGDTRVVSGVRAALGTARSNGIFTAIVPKDTPDSELIAGMKVYKVSNLQEAFAALNKSPYIDPVEVNETNETGVTFPYADEDFDWGSIPPYVRRAMMIASAGKHNMIAVGAPGCGKTIAMQHMRDLMPSLTKDEEMSVTRIKSLAGYMGEKNRPDEPPFRMPHQTASIEGICGGGVNCRPGEISLAHNGILFLDDAMEFKSSVLQMLRVPLESRTITLSRAGRTTMYPARFQLLMATNPCPCGNYGVKGRMCLCSAKAIEQYWKKMSGPLLDRIEIGLDYNNIEEAESLSVEEMRAKIAQAIEVQRERGAYNAWMTPEQVANLSYTDDALAMMREFTSREDLSPRRTAALAKVARTIADIDGFDVIDVKQVSEAIEYTKRPVCMGL